MKTFAVTVDKKFEVWHRLDIEFQAKDEAEAKTLLEKWNGVPPDSEYINTETLLDTEHAMSFEENGNQPVWDIQADLVEIP